MVLERQRVPDNLENMELLARKLRLGFGVFLGFSERSCLPFRKAAADLPLIYGNLDLTLQVWCPCCRFEAWMLMIPKQIHEHAQILNCNYFISFFSLDSNV